MIVVQHDENPHQFCVILEDLENENNMNEIGRFERIQSDEHAETKLANVIFAGLNKLVQ